MIKDKDNVTLEDVLQPGTNMLAAGYCMYGSSCTVIESSKPVFPQHNLLLSVPSEIDLYNQSAAACSEHWEWCQWLHT